MKNELKDSPAVLPLSDGTPCTLTEHALWVLGYEFGITSGRIKKGAAGHATIMVRPTAASYRDSLEVPLKDLLAVAAYRMGGDSEPGQKFILRDGDPRNLLPGNIALSVLPEVEAEHEPKSKPRKQKATTSSALPLEMQLELLGLAVAGHSYIGQDGQWKRIKPLVCIGTALLRSAPLADEICGEVVLSLVEQCHAGMFRGNSSGEFFSWVRESARRQFGKRLDGVLQKYISDVETDPSAIRLRKVMHAESREALSPEHVLPFKYESERADAGRTIERAERAEKERKRKELEDLELAVA